MLFKSKLTGILFVIFTILHSTNINAQLDFKWASGFGDAGTDICNAIALNENEELFFGASFSGTVDFDPGAGVVELISAGASDIAFGKFDSSGNLLWVNRIGGTLGEGAIDLSLDPSGN